MELGNISLTDYLNKVHVTSDPFLIETQKHSIEKYKTELDNFLHLSFAENCDALLQILDTYKYCRSLLESMVVPQIAGEEAPCSVNAAGQKKFVQACRRFTSSMAPFFTPDRFLVKAAEFEGLYCVMTNDLLFVGLESGTELEKNVMRAVEIGRKESRSHESGGSPNSSDENQTRSYVLANSLDKHAVSLAKAGSHLVLSNRTGLSYELRADPETIEEFYDAYQGDVYDPSSPPPADSNIDRALVEFYIETEQIGKLADYAVETKSAGTILHGPNQPLVITNPEDLKKAMVIFNNPLQIFMEFVSQRFAAGLLGINKIQRVRELIDDTFDFLEGFVAQLEEIVAENEFPRQFLILSIEQLIIQIFEFLDKRIFNKFYEVAMSNENIQRIKERLAFRKFDFCYLIRRLTERRNSFADVCIAKAKKEIDEKLDLIYD